jgi:hypothetical protein
LFPYNPLMDNLCLGRLLAWFAFRDADESWRKYCNLMRCLSSKDRAPTVYTQET